jgi:hypothetical protein
MHNWLRKVIKRLCAVTTNSVLPQLPAAAPRVHCGIAGNITPRHDYDADDHAWLCRSDYPVMPRPRSIVEVFGKPNLVRQLCAMTDLVIPSSRSRRILDVGK